MVSVKKIYTDMAAFLRLQHPRASRIRMPYCSLYENPVTKESYYRVEMAYFRKPEDWVQSNAIAEVDAESGEIRMFKDGYRWEVK